MNVFYDDDGNIVGISKNSSEFDLKYIQNDDIAWELLRGERSIDDYMVYRNRILAKTYVSKRKVFNDMIVQSDRETGHTTRFTTMTLSEISRQFQPDGFVEWRLNTMVKEIFPFGNNIVNLSELYIKKQRMAELFYTIYTLSLVDGPFDSPIGIFFTDKRTPLIHPGGTRTALMATHDEQLDVVLTFCNAPDVDFPTFSADEFYCKHYDMDIVRREMDEQFHNYMTDLVGDKYRVVYGEFNTNRSVVYTNEKTDVIIEMRDDCITSDGKRFLSNIDGVWEIDNGTTDNGESSN